MGKPKGEAPAEPRIAAAQRLSGSFALPHMSFLAIQNTFHFLPVPPACKSSKAEGAGDRLDGGASGLALNGLGLCQSVAVHLTNHCGGNDDRQSEDDRGDHNGQCRVLIFLDLLA